MKVKVCGAWARVLASLSSSSLLFVSLRMKQWKYFYNPNTNGLPCLCAWLAAKNLFAYCCIFSQVATSRVDVLVNSYE